MKKRIFTGLVLGAMMMGALTGCGEAKDVEQSEKKSVNKEVVEAMDVEVDAFEDEWDWDYEPKQVDLSWLAYELIVVNLPLVHSHQDGGCNPEMDALLQDHLCTDVEDEE